MSEQQEQEQDLYSIEDSSVYSYQDLAIYQYSDAEDETPVRSVAATVCDDDDDDDEEVAEWNHWNNYDNESFVMHIQSDNDDDIDLYQFSDEDLIPEEPDEEWIVAALLANRQDFIHLELMLETLEDFPRLIHALQRNQVIQTVTIYEKLFQANLPTDEEKTILAETICQLSQLEQLKVYYHSSYFVKPLERIRPPLLKRLCLMFFPELANPDTLAALTRILKDENPSSAVPEEDTNATTAISPSLPPTTTPSLLEFLSLRCNVMDDEFIHAIASGMAVNSTLTTLSFWGNKVQVTEKGAEDSARIDFYLRLNQCGIRDLHLLVNATPSEFLDKIVEERTSLDMVFYMLQTNPSFLSYYSSSSSFRS